MTLPPHLARIVEADYPRFSAAEMARHRAAVEALLAEAQCDHLIFCGANRFGSVVQYLTQWPVTAEAVGVFTPGQRDALFVQWINHAAAGVAAGRPGRRRLGRRVVDCLGGRGAGQTRRAAGSRRQHRPAVAPSSTPALPRSSARRRISTAPYTRHRQVKSEEEIDWLRIGAHFTDLGMSGLRDGLEAGLTRARTRRSDRARLCQARRRSILFTTSASPRCMRPISACRASFLRRAACRRATSWWPRSPRHSGIIPGRCCAVCAW